MKKVQVEYYVYKDAAGFARHAAQFFADQIGAAVEKRGVARIAISGGNTPRPVFALLSGDEFHDRVPWRNVQLFWVDERCVPPDHKDSNYGMTKAALLDKVPLSPTNVFRMEGELDPEEAAARYESAIRGQFRLEGAELPTFDLVALGMGDDGHTASLFPHTAGLHELGRIVIANHVPQKNTWRITQTSPVINHARNVIFLIQGADKAAVLQRVLQGPYDPETLPSQLIQPANGKITILLDEAAAAQLPPTVESGGQLEVDRSKVAQ
jgi:6-phosphogluconolactonase